MSFRWHDGHVLPFLEAYRKYELLWNPSLPEYRNHQLREKALASMVTDMALPGLTVSDIRLKIKSVRTRYASELTKVRSTKTSGAGADDIYQPKLFWFPTADAFLRRWTLAKNRPSNLTTLACASATDSESSEEHPDDQRFAGEEAELRATSSRASTSSRSADSQQPRKRKTQHSDAISVSGLRNIMGRPQEPSETKQRELPHEFDIFGQGVAAQLKNMSLHRALICQEKIQKILTAARLEQLRDQTSVTTVLL